MSDREAFERIAWEEFNNGLYDDNQRKCFFSPFDEKNDRYGDILMNQNYQWFKKGRAQALDECLDIATTYGHPNVIATVIKQLKEQP